MDNIHKNHSIYNRGLGCELAFASENPAIIALLVLILDGKVPKYLLRSGIALLNIDTISISFCLQEPAQSPLPKAATIYNNNKVLSIFKSLLLTTKFPNKNLLS